MKEFDCTSRRISQYTQKELEKHFATGRWVLISSSRQVSHSIQNTKHILNGGWPSKCPHSAPTSSPPAANETAPPRNSNLQGESVKQMHTEIPAFFRFRKPRNAHKQEQTGIALALFVSLKTALLLKACSLRKEVFFCKGSIYVYILNIYIYLCVCDCICVSPFLTGSFLHPPNDEQLPGCTGGSSRTHSPCSGRSPGKQRKPTSSAEVLMDFCLQTVGLPNACHGTR